MIDTIRKKILGFIESDKDVPLLAGLSVGFYVILFYYARNFSLGNSWSQFFFFIGYFAVFPAIVLFAGYKLLRVIKLQRWQKHFLFVGLIGFFSLFFLQINYTIEHKKIILPAIVILSALLSLKFSRYYKLLLLLLLFMSVFNLPGVAETGMIALKADNSWKKQPDDIEKAVFKQKPNIYYIQPDGYASFANLKDTIHNFDNHDYENFLKNNGFELYDDYRSNYQTTLLSNSATFSMKHHFAAEEVYAYEARDIIMGRNPVLDILHNNGYTAAFITESPYLLMNRPNVAYDITNISRESMPYFGDGGSDLKDVFVDLKSAMEKQPPGPVFYFIEKFTPSHIYNTSAASRGREVEKEEYLKRLQEANIWLKEMITHIEKHDKDALIIIGADHGGFVGFEYSQQSLYKIEDSLLKNSMFGAQLAIRWNNEESVGYDRNLKTGVNLFRTVFSFLARDKKYLQHLQEDGSYAMLFAPKGTYRYIDSNGKRVFEKK